MNYRIALANRSADFHLTIIWNFAILDIIVYYKVKSSDLNSRNPERLQASSYSHVTGGWEMTLWIVEDHRSI